MKLRDKFAVEAMKALILEPQWVGCFHQDSLAGRITGSPCDEDSLQARIYAEAAYMIADAMMDRRAE